MTYPLSVVLVLHRNHVQQGSPSGVARALVTSAFAFIKICSALHAKAFAIRPAHSLHGRTEIDVLDDGFRQVQYVAPINVKVLVELAGAVKPCSGINVDLR